MKTAEKKDKLLQYGLRIIAKKRYTELQLREKLAKYLVKNEEVFEEVDGEVLSEQVIERLKELHYLDDAQFVRDYVHDRSILKPRGKFLLRRELKRKGVSEALIEKFVTPLNESPMAKELLKKQMKKWADQPLFKQRQKAFNFLRSKGFEADVVYKTIGYCYDRADVGS